MSTRRTGTAGPPMQSRRGYVTEIRRRALEATRADLAASRARDLRDQAVAAGLAAGLTAEMAARVSGLSVGMVRHIAREHREIVPRGRPGPKPQPRPEETTP